MHDILIIGTEPPCPRCGLITRYIKSRCETLGLNARVRHLAYHEPEAIAFAQSAGLVPGTAKDVALLAGVPIDKDKLSACLSDQADITGPDEAFLPFNEGNWSPALDEFLAPYQQLADQYGVLMTPVLVINNRLVHQGSVPSVQLIEAVLKAL